MAIQLNKKVIQMLVLIVCLNFYGCVKDGGLTPRVLDGKWELKSVNNQPITDLVTWEFEDDGDFKFCSDGECYSGDWEWNSDKDEVEIDYTDGFGDAYRIEFEIDVLDKETLEGDWNYDGDLYILEFERDD